MNIRIRFNVRGYIDRRSLDLHQQHDELIERVWRARVARHDIERARLAREARAVRLIVVQPEVLTPQT